MDRVEGITYQSVYGGEFFSVMRMVPLSLTRDASERVISFSLSLSGSSPYPPCFFFFFLDMWDVIEGIAPSASNPAADFKKSKRRTWFERTLRSWSDIPFPIPL